MYWGCGRVERGAERGDVAPERRLGAGVPLPAPDLDQLQGEPGEQLELDPEAHQRLEVRGHMGGRLVELGGHQLHVPVDEDLLPGHEHVVEHDGGVDLVEARGERVVVDARRERRVGPARQEPEALRIHRHHERDGVVHVPGSERGDVAHVEPVGHGHRRGDRVRAADHDARVRLLQDARVEKRLRMLVGRRGAVDLGRDDRIGQVQVLVARLLVEPDHVVAELPAPAVEELAPAREGGEHRGHVVGGASHEAVRALGPEPVHGPPAPQIIRGARDQPHGADPLAGGRIQAGGDVGGGPGRLVPLRDALGGLGEGGMAGDVVDPLAVEEHGAPVAEAREVVGGPAHGGTLAYPSGGAQAG